MKLQVSNTAPPEQGAAVTEAVGLGFDVTEIELEVMDPQLLLTMQQQKR